MKTKSFTLIELLVVIVIIGILAGVIIVSTSSSIGKANFAKAQAFSNTVQQELLLNLVSEWTFDEDPIGTAKDTWGNNNGTLYGANGLPQLQTKENCVYGTCYLFDGVDDYIDCGGTNQINFSDEVSLFAWIKVSSDIGATRIGNIIGNHSNVPNFQLEVGSYGRVRVWWNGGERDINSTNFDARDDVWHYVGFTRSLDKNIIRMYTDGSLNNSTTAATTKTYYWPLRIGGDFRATPGIPFHGMIDEIRLYSTALSTSQIKQNYIAGLNSLLASNSISKDEYNERINSLALHDD